MKNTKSNGAAIQAAKTLALETVNRGNQIREYVKTAAERTRERIAKRAEKAGVEVTIKLSADSYGLLAKGMIIHGLTVEKMVEAIFNDGDMLCQWSNEGCPIGSDTVIF